VRFDLGVRFDTCASTHIDKTQEAEGAGAEDAEDVRQGAATELANIS
jgi:hypothetical protein